MRGGGKLLRPCLDRERYGCSQDAGNQHGSYHGVRKAEMWMLHKRYADGREHGADTYLQDCHLLKGEALCASSQQYDLESERDSAPDGEQVTGIDVGEISQGLAPGRNRHQEKPGERQENSHHAPAMNPGSPEYDQHQRHRDRGHAGKERRF